MTDDNPETLPETPETIPEVAPAPPEPVKAVAPKRADTDPHAGFAVYDLTLTRFVGGVGATKSAAQDTVDKVKGHKYETRAV